MGCGAGIGAKETAPTGIMFRISTAINASGASSTTSRTLAMA